MTQISCLNPWTPEPENPSVVQARRPRSTAGQAGAGRTCHSERSEESSTSETIRCAQS